MKNFILFTLSCGLALGVGLPKATVPNLSPPQLKVPEPQAPEQPKVPVVQAPATDAENHPLITAVKKRNKTIFIKSSPGGPLYTVTDKKGKELVKDMNEADLAKKDPKLHEFVKSAVAADPKAKGIIDASVNK